MDSDSGDEFNADSSSSDSECDESFIEREHGSLLLPHPLIYDLHMGSCYQAAELTEGYRLEDVTIPDNTSYIMCQICKRVPRELLVLSGCNHIFCKCCFDKKMNQPPNPYGKCPECSTKFIMPPPLVQQQGTNSVRPKWLSYKLKCPEYSMHRLYPISELDHPEPFIMRKKWLSYKVKCPEGCGYVGNPGDVDSHQIATCELRPVLCLNDGCYVVCLEKNMLAHYRHCPFRPKFCSKCQLYLPASIFNNHICISQLKQAVARMRRCQI